MRYPTMSRENSRYRGPMESHKFNHIHDSVLFDLTYIAKRIALIQEDTMKTFGDSYDSIHARTEQMYYVDANNAFLKGGDSRV